MNERDRSWPSPATMASREVWDLRQEMRGVTGQPACASPKWQRSEDGLARLESGGRESCIGQKLEINRSHTHAYPPCPFGSALHCMKVLRRKWNTVLHCPRMSSKSAEIVCLSLPLSVAVSARILANVQYLRWICP